MSSEKPSSGHRCNAEEHMHMHLQPTAILSQGFRIDNGNIRKQMNSGKQVYTIVRILDVYTIRCHIYYL